MAVDSSQLNSASRDAYWLTTQAELKSAQKRGDIFSLLGLGLVAAMFWFYSEPSHNVVSWAAGVATVVLAVVVLPQIFVAQRKRHISTARGMNCQHCGYVPHATEISEVASTRECPRCEKPLG